MAWKFENKCLNFHFANKVIQMILMWLWWLIGKVLVMIFCQVIWCGPCTDSWKIFQTRIRQWTHFLIIQFNFTIRNWWESLLHWRLFRWKFIYGKLLGFAIWFVHFLKGWSRVHQFTNTWIWCTGFDKKRFCQRVSPDNNHQATFGDKRSRFACEVV